MLEKAQEAIDQFEPMLSPAQAMAMHMEGKSTHEFQKEMLANCVNGDHDGYNFNMASMWDDMRGEYAQTCIKVCRGPDPCRPCDLRAHFLRKFKSMCRCILDGEGHDANWFEVSYRPKKN